MVDYMCFEDIGRDYADLRFKNRGATPQNSLVWKLQISEFLKENIFLGT